MNQNRLYITSLCNTVPKTTKYKIKQEVIHQAVSQADENAKLEKNLLLE